MYWLKTKEISLQGVGNPHFAAINDIVIAILLAVVLMAATSEPACTSDTAIEATYSPAMAGVKTHHVILCCQNAPKQVLPYPFVHQ